jgi:hypothetical protein
MTPSLTASVVVLLSTAVAGCGALRSHGVNPLSSQETYAAFNRKMLDSLPPGAAGCQVQDVVVPLSVARETAINTTRIYQCQARQAAILVSFSRSLVQNRRNASRRLPGSESDEYPVIGGSVVFEWPDPVFPKGEGHAAHLFGDDAVMVIGISGVTRTDQDLAFVKDFLGRIDVTTLQRVVSSVAR